MLEKLWEFIKKVVSHFLYLLRWALFAVLSGILIGSIGALFYHCLRSADLIRADHPWIVFLLPVGGLFIVFAYRILHDEADTGTNLVLSAIQSGEHIPLRMAPLIFFSTVLTHLFGGSSGREGAALQLGGSIGSKLGNKFGFDEKDLHIMIMCGMSAAFSALFGTPLAASIFSLEVVSVGIMHYSALVPCAISSLTAHAIAGCLGVKTETFTVGPIPEFTPGAAVWFALMAVFFAGASILFCVALHMSERLFKRYAPNPYLRIFAGGCLVVLLTLLVGNQDYNGAGMDVIQRCFMNEYVPYAFLLKILFTAITLGSGFKGGEIMPSFFIGATLGCLLGNIADFAPGLSAAVGMGAVFCGVTNCPITSLFLSFELFGFSGMPYFLLAISISYMLSGYYGLYRSQKIVYSKFKTEFINRKTR